jgi:hypothetical protein
MLATFGNEAELIDFLRFVGRNPGGFSTSSSALLRGIGAVPEAVAFGRRFGVRVLASFWRRFAGADAENRAAALRATTAYLGDPSVTPEVRAQRLAQLEVLTSRLEFERAIGTAPPPVPRPPRPNATTLGIDRNAAEWDTLHTEEADLAQRRGLTLTDAELATWADLQQIFSRARRGDFIGLGRDALLRILDEYERRAVDARMPRLLINARRGRLAELFFGPRPARPQQAYLGGVPVPYSTAGASRPDYWITPEEAVTAGEPPRAFTEFVDLKSDLINSGTVRAGDRAYTAGVRAATQYVGHAAADQPNLPAGARISLDFVRSTNPATTRAMLDILFTASSRIYRVRFGGGAWQTNPHYVPP